MISLVNRGFGPAIIDSVEVLLSGVTIPTPVHPSDWMKLFKLAGGEDIKHGTGAYFPKGTVIANGEGRTLFSVDCSLETKPMDSFLTTKKALTNISYVIQYESIYGDSARVSMQLAPEP